MMGRRARKIRRKVRRLLKYGPKAVPSHRSKGGRTGDVHSRKTPPKHEGSEVDQTPLDVEIDGLGSTAWPLGSQ